MSLDLTKCRGCGAKIARVFADGTLRYDRRTMAQVTFVYELDSNSSKCSQVHVPCCTKCENNLPKDEELQQKFIAKLEKTDKSFRRWIKDKPFTLKQVKPYALPVYEG